MCNCEDRTTLDMETPKNVHLTAFYKRSFAYHTVRHRMPIIVTQLIDSLVRNKDQIIKTYGELAREELKIVIAELSELKYEIQTNKPLRRLISNAPDVQFYNEYLMKQMAEDGSPKYFNCIWLLSECYMYRRIKEIFQLRDGLKDFDYFKAKKVEAFNVALPMIEQLGAYVLNEINSSAVASKTGFVTLLKWNLWGNKCDLSLSNGIIGSNNENETNIEKLDPYILSDHSEQIWKAISDTDNTRTIIDIILDNAGYEVVCDMCLADYLISNGLAKEIRFYVKTIPWFISDTMTADFHWVLDELRNSPSKVLKTLGDRWSKYVDGGQWTIHESNFWTLPVDFTYMKEVEPELYKKLAEAKLAVFKGDLNYRKLFGEKNWDPTTSVEEGLQGFNPSQLCTLRTIKSDIVCGIDKNAATRAEKEDKKWMETGNFGLIQFCDVINNIEGQPV